MQEQVTQVEFMSRAGEPHPRDTISEGATLCAALLCQAAAPEPCNHHPHLPLTITGKQLVVHKGKFFILRPRNIA